MLGRIFDMLNGHYWKKRALRAEGDTEVCRTSLVNTVIAYNTLIEKLSWIAGRHQPITNPAGRWCNECGSKWPCPTYNATLEGAEAKAHKDDSART